MKRRSLSTGFYVGLAVLLLATILSVVFTGNFARQGPRLEPIQASSVSGNNDMPAANGPAKGSEMTPAAAQNVRLKTDLEWAFGGKAQHGWYLYTPLICELIGTNKDADSSDFAAALARWQRSVGLAPGGILDGETWLRMISVWQSRRSKDHAVASPNQLLTAPASDFYDPSRPDELRKVEPQAYTAYKRMVAAAAADQSALGAEGTRDGEITPAGQFLKIVSAFRSPEYQDRLRKQSPNAGSAGLAKNSPHFTGRALDLYVGGDPVSTDDRNRALQTQTLAYKWLVKNAGRFGFYPYFYEPWHWEYRAP